MLFLANDDEDGRVNCVGLLMASYILYVVAGFVSYELCNHVFNDSSQRGKMLLLFA